MQPKIKAKFGPPKRAVCPHCGEGPVYWHSPVVWDVQHQRLRPAASDSVVMTNDGCTCAICGTKSTTPGWKDV